MCSTHAAVAFSCPPGTHHDATLVITTDPDQCLGCDPGTACPLGTFEPLNCTAGSFAASANSSTCLSCPAGTYQDEPAAVDCKLCTKGHFCPRGSTSPVACPPGSYGPNAGGESLAEQCVPVTSGFYAPMGSIAPIPCPFDAFFYCPGAAEDDVNEFPGSSPIMLPAAACPPGEEAIQQVGDLKVCVPCRRGHYCVGGVSFKCSDGSWHNETGQSNASSCLACPPEGSRCVTGDILDVSAHRPSTSLNLPAFLSLSACRFRSKSHCLLSLLGRLRSKSHCPLNLSPDPPATAPIS